MDVNVSEVTTCRVTNSIDNKVIILCAKWTEDHLELNVIRNDNFPLTGQISKVKLSEPAETYQRTAEEYLQEIKYELAGKDNEVKFSLKNDVLTWKKRVWNRGLIKCEPFNDIILFSRLVHSILVSKSTVEESEVKYKEENENLKRKISEMDAAMIKMTCLKNTMESALCRKFLFILNSKKDLIINLKDEIKKLSKADSAYDKSTDVSDNESEDDKVESIYPSKRMRRDNSSQKMLEKVSVEMETESDKSKEDTMFNEIAKKIEQENSIFQFDENEYKYATNGNDSDDSDINLKYEDSQTVVEPKNDTQQDLFSSQ
ncbi:uncharacterized protein LOC103576770 [Microplitis demolitor]|uniref:uncharacterized protein LOC103576770 n=1 Tax=Microplitis demolitor TaxID=69319 RepID=UPI0004CDC10E|nr:uncharacterized protein LOC103576770 [Microplitis demolitor]